MSFNNQTYLGRKNRNSTSMCKWMALVHSRADLGHCWETLDGMVNRTSRQIGMRIVLLDVDTSKGNAYLT